MNLQDSHSPRKAGKTWENKETGKSGNILISPKSKGKLRIFFFFFLNANYCEIKNYCDFHLKNVTVIIPCQVKLLAKC